MSVTTGITDYFSLASDMDLIAEENAQLRQQIEVYKLIFTEKELKELPSPDSNFIFTPAKIIKDFRKKSDKPFLKGAFIEESIYIGDENLDALVAIKSKEELLGEIVSLLQSPAKNVISALQSSGGTIAGIVKTLSEKPE